MPVKIRIPIPCPNCGATLYVNVARALGMDKNCPECGVYIQLEYKKDPDSDKTTFYFSCAEPGK